MKTKATTVHDPGAEAELRESLHELNNALNSLSMQSEIVRMYLEQGKLDMAGSALRTVMSECRKAASIVHDTQRRLPERRS